MAKKQLSEETKKAIEEGNKIRKQLEGKAPKKNAASSTTTSSSSTSSSTTQAAEPANA